MKTCWISLLICFYFLPSFSLLAQVQETHVPGQLIVMLKAGMEKQEPKLHPIQVNGKQVDFEETATLSTNIRIYLFEFDAKSTDEDAVLRGVRSLPQVELAQFNHYVEEREAQATIPNDASFGTQWDMDNTGQSGGTVDADIDAPEAWDIATGGLTALGDTIVVAVIDGGCDLNHIDLNLWKNHAEIPNNGIDDDNNGYVDDYDGWNAYNNNGNMPNDGHGTHVSGTVSAKGNNGIGVSGVNWDAQVMPIAGSSGNEATVVIAYDYALTMRTLYNQSNGAQGAFVVATNSSFGVDFANPQNYPIWCAMYDSMGMQGILSAAATMNNNSNVDNTGDVPTACGSDWMISVTNTTHNDTRNNGAAYGLTTIDLGAPGSNILSTTPNNNYSSFTGTSMATPHVAGAVALLLSGPCPGFVTQYKQNPGMMALVLRDYIFQGVDTIPALNGFTVTGGRLNIFNSLQFLQTDCGLYTTCSGIDSLTFSQITDSSASIDWLAADSIVNYEIQIKPNDSSQWTTAGMGDTSLIFAFDNLEACTQYDIRVLSVCDADSGTVGYSLPFTFQTEGCCEAPDALQLTATTDSTTGFSWQSVYGATQYEIRYRRVGESLWNSTLANDTSLVLDQLDGCARYEIQVSTICINKQLGFSPSIFITTLGCEICQEANYCSDQPMTMQGFIDSLEIGPILNISGDNNGYASFITSDHELIAGSSYAIRLVPDSSELNPYYKWRIWIDMNQDSVFSDSTEVLYESAFLRGPISDSIHIPFTVPLGRTRLRVSAKILTDDISAPEACGGFPHGETEDYCVRFEAQCGPIDRLSLIRRQDSSGFIDVDWTALHPDFGYLLEYRPVGLGAWTQVNVDSNATTLGPLPQCDLYEFRVRPLCSPDTGQLAYGAPIWTVGCEDCRDGNYCEVKGLDAQSAWIELVHVGTLANSSGSNQGYGSFVDQSLDVIKGQTIGFELYPGLNNSQQVQYWRIWMDINQDGDMGDQGELVYDAAPVFNTIVIDSFLVPANALSGPTRLRISMGQGAAADACGAFAEGEVEEYCMRVLPLVSIDSELERQIDIFPNPVQDVLQIQSTLEIEQVEMFDVRGRMRWSSGSVLTKELVVPTGNLAIGMYQLFVHTTQGTIVKKVAKIE